MKGVFIALIAIQIGIDLAHSVSFFPFVHYGMYSLILPRRDSVEIYEVTVDGRRLQPTDLIIYRWDMVQTPLEAFDRQTATHDFAFDKAAFQRGMQWAGGGSVYSHLKTNLDNTGIFVPWYKTYLSGLLGRPIGTLIVEKAWYHWKGGRLERIGKEPWFNL
ncbi:MAG TPA: hypothetical protein VNU70_04560 [Puia sp.]|jgi:hypothetical protein|nr:hypothetical protein [Puia sp.]